MLSACRKITDVLPFDKKNRWIINNSELLKQLIFAMPYIHSTADLIINSLLYKFQSQVDFIFAFQKALEAIAAILDPEVRMELQNIKINQFQSNSRVEELTLEATLSGTEMMRSGFGYEDDNSEPTQQNLQNIKRLSLIYAKKLFEVYALMLSRGVYTLKKREDDISPFSFIKLLVVSTSNAALIMESQQWFQSLKGKPPWSLCEEDVLGVEQSK